MIVEVKTRQSGEHGPPDRAIGPRSAASGPGGAGVCAKTDTPLDQVRFDVVTVILANPKLRPEIVLFRRAFTVRV